MSDRPLIAPYQVIANGDMSAAITGKVSILLKLSMVAYSFSWAGTSPVGTVSIQVSSDYSENSDGSVRNPGTWSNLPLSYAGSSATAIPVSGNTGNGLVDIEAVSAYAIRPVYNFVSGVGSLQCIVNAKVA